MVPKIVLVQFRTQKEVLDHEAECIARDLSIPQEKLIVYNAIQHDLSNLDVTKYNGFIFGGSGEVSVSSNNQLVKTIR